MSQSPETALVPRPDLAGRMLFRDGVDPPERRSDPRVSGPWWSRDPALARIFGSGYEAYAGIAVTPEVAFTFSAVYDAVNQIASDVAKLPLVLRKKRQGGGSDPYEASKLYSLLKNEPNPEMTSMVFRRTIMAHALTCHGGFAEIERDGAGRPYALWILTPDRVEPIRQEIRQGVYGPLEYRIDGRTMLSARDVIHIHGLGYDGYCAYGVINKARQTIGLALAAERFGAQFFGKGTMLGGWVESGEDLDEDQKADTIKNIQKMREMQDNAWRILIMEAGQKFHEFSARPKDSQMDESRIRQIEEVARFFRLQPYRLGVNTPGTVSYASVEMSNLDYYTGCLLDWITLVEQEFNRKLISPLERGQQFIKHNVNAFLRGTIKERFEALAIARQNGVINANQWLDLEDMNPQEGDQGNIYVIQSGFMPLDKVSDLVQSQIDKNKQPPPAPVAPAAAKPSDDEAKTRELERLLAEAREALSASQAALAAADATGTATAGELEELRAQVRSHSGAVIAFTQIETELRGQKDALTERVTEKDAELVTVRGDLVVVAERHLAAEQERDRLAGELAQAEERERNTKQAFQDAEAARTVAEQELRTEKGNREAAETNAREAREAVDEAERRLSEATSEREAAAEALATAERTATETRQATEQAHAEAIAVAERARLEAEDIAADARRIAAEYEARAAKADMERETAARQALELAHAESAAEKRAEQAEAAHAAEKTERERVEAFLREQISAIERAEQERLAGALSAHRSLVVDVMTRMLDHEAQRVRRAQSTPDRLRQHLETFYDGYGELCHRALLPVVRTHLAWTRSTEDAQAVTRRLVAMHVERSQRDLRIALDTEGTELAVSVPATLRAWEQDRPSLIADWLFERGIDHVARSRR